VQHAAFAWEQHFIAGALSSVFTAAASVFVSCFTEAVCALEIFTPIKQMIERTTRIFFIIRSLNFIMQM
jgi:hypothetical protein